MQMWLYFAIYGTIAAGKDEGLEDGRMASLFDVLSLPVSGVDSTPFVSYGSTYVVTACPAMTPFSVGRAARRLSRREANSSQSRGRSKGQNQTKVVMSESKSKIVSPRSGAYNTAQNRASGVFPSCLVWEKLGNVGL